MFLELDREINGLNSGDTVDVKVEFVSALMWVSYLPSSQIVTMEMEKNIKALSVRLGRESHVRCGRSSHLTSPSECLSQHGQARSRGLFTSPAGFKEKASVRSFV